MSSVCLLSQKCSILTQMCPDDLNQNWGGNNMNKVFTGLLHVVDVCVRKDLIPSSSIYLSLYLLSGHIS